MAVEHLKTWVHQEYSPANNKQLLDEVEHDITNYQCKGLNYEPKLNTEADNSDTRFDNSHNVKNWIVDFYWIICKRSASLWVYKSLIAPHGWGAWKLGRLWTWHDNPISAAANYK